MFVNSCGCTFGLLRDAKTSSPTASCLATAAVGQLRVVERERAVLIIDGGGGAHSSSGPLCKPQFVQPTPALIPPYLPTFFSHSHFNPPHSWCYYQRIPTALQTITFLQHWTSPMSPYFLEAFQGALHIFITSEHVRERALHGVEVCQSSFLLHGHSVQSLLRAQGVSLLVLWEEEGRRHHRGMTNNSLLTLYKLEVVCVELVTTYHLTLTDHLSDCLLIFSNNLPVMKKHMIRLT